MVFNLLLASWAGSGKTFDEAFEIRQLSGVPLCSSEPFVLACRVLIPSEMRVAALALVLIVAASGRAAAAGDDASASPFESRPTAIFGILGLGTPVGSVGVEMEQMVLPNWSLSAGAGWGAANALQGAAMVRWLVGSPQGKLTIGAGISGGKYQWTDFFCIDCEDGPVTKSGTVAWANLEVGSEIRLSSGLALRFFGGYGHIIAGNLVCDPPATSCGPYYQDAGYDLIYLGGGVGYAF